MSAIDLSMLPGSSIWICLHRRLDHELSSLLSTKEEAILYFSNSVPPACLSATVSLYIVEHHLPGAKKESPAETMMLLISRIPDVRERLYALSDTDFNHPTFQGNTQQKSKCAKMNWERAKHTADGIPTWSPTVVLIVRFAA